MISISFTGWITVIRAFSLSEVSTKNLKTLRPELLGYELRELQPPPLRCFRDSRNEPRHAKWHYPPALRKVLRSVSGLAPKPISSKLEIVSVDIST